MEALAIQSYLPHRKTQKNPTDIQAMSEIRTHDLSVKVTSSSCVP